MKKKMSKIAAIILTMAFLVTGIPFTNTAETAMAATGLNMNSTTIQGYPYTNNNFPVYNSSDPGNVKIGTCFGSTDYVIVHGVWSNGWSRITYPTGNSTKTGYCWTEYLFQNPDFNGATGTVQSPIKTSKLMPRQTAANSSGLLQKMTRSLS